MHDDLNMKEHPATITVKCHDCGKNHVGDFYRYSKYNDEPLYAVECTADWLTGYYQLEHHDSSLTVD